MLGSVILFNVFVAIVVDAFDRVRGEQERIGFLTFMNEQVRGPRAAVLGRLLRWQCLRGCAAGCVGCGEQKRGCGGGGYGARDVQGARSDRQDPTECLAPCVQALPPVQKAFKRLQRIAEGDKDEEEEEEEEEDEVWRRKQVSHHIPAASQCRVSARRRPRLLAIDRERTGASQ